MIGPRQATAPALIDGLPTSQAVIADRGYDWQYLVDLVASRGEQAHFPPSATAGSNALLIANSIASAT